VVAVVKPRPGGAWPERLRSELRGGSHHAQQSGGNTRHHQAPASAAGPGAQVRQPARAHASQPALHVNLWLDFREALAKSSASSKRMAADQGGSGATGSSQRRREDRYTLDAALDEPWKFHSTPGREATHSTRQCSFIKELKQRARQLPGSPPEQPAEGQEDHQYRPAAEQPDQGDNDYPAVSSSTTSSPLRRKTKGMTFGMRRR
jgi:hypothetical protein